MRENIHKMAIEMGGITNNIVVVDERELKTTQGTLYPLDVVLKYVIKNG